MHCQLGIVSAGDDEDEDACVRILASVTQTSDAASPPR